MRVILAGGGTGGHLYPAIAVAEKLHAQKVDTLFMVSNRGIEKQVLDNLGYTYIEQDVSGFSGVNILQKIKALYKFVKAIFASLKIVQKGDKVLLFGGFVAAPVAVAAILKGADLYVHEQNSVMGLVNRIVAKSCKKVFASYEDTARSPVKAILVGNPVRAELMHAKVKSDITKNLLIIGGSSGSRKINMVVAKAAKRLTEEGFSILHQTGEKLFDETIKEYEKHIDFTATKVKITPYLSDMKNSYANADIIIARAGSGAVFEVTYAKRAAIYIPFAAATDNHQYYNALSAVKNGYAKVVDEDSLNADTLFNAVVDVYREIDRYNEALSGAEVYDSAKDIIKLMLES